MRFVIVAVISFVNMYAYACDKEIVSPVLVHSEEGRGQAKGCQSLRISFPKQVGGYDGAIAQLSYFSHLDQHAKVTAYLLLTEAYEDDRLQTFVCLDDEGLKTARISVSYNSRSTDDVATMCNQEIVVTDLGALIE